MGVCVGCVCFWCCFAYVFALLLGFSLPKLSLKNSLDVRSGVSGFFLSSFGFFADVVAFLFFFSFFREIDQVVTGHTPTRTLCFFVLFFLCPRRDRVYLPFWPCVLSFWRFVGVPFWAPGVLAFFGFSRYLGGLRLLTPF